MSILQLPPKRTPTWSDAMKVKRARGRNSEAPHLWHGLVGCWPFGAGGGSTAYDLSGYGNHGTLTNMDPATDWVTTEKGYALDFDGTDDHVDIGTIFTSANGSLELWVYLISVSHKDTLCAQTISGSMGLGFQIQGSDSAFFVNGNLAAGQTTALLKWHHLVGTWGSGAMQFYVNGEWKATNAYTGVPTGSAAYPFRLAEFYYYGGHVFHPACRIAKFAVWEQALARPEIQQLYVDPYALVRPRRRVFVAAVVVGNPWYAFAQMAG